MLQSCIQKSRLGEPLLFCIQPCNFSTPQGRRSNGLLFFVANQCRTASVGSNLSNVGIFIFTYKRSNKLGGDIGVRSVSLTFLYVPNEVMFVIKGKERKVFNNY